MQQSTATSAVRHAGCTTHFDNTNVPQRPSSSSRSCLTGNSYSCRSINATFPFQRGKGLFPSDHCSKQHKKDRKKQLMLQSLQQVLVFSPCFCWCCLAEGIGACASWAAETLSPKRCRCCVRVGVHYVRVLFAILLKLSACHEKQKQRCTWTHELKKHARAN